MTNAEGLKDIKDIIVAIICSGAFFAFVQFLIQRHDTKKGLEKKIDEVQETLVKEVNDVKETMTNEVGALSTELAEHKATLARTHILRFADELHNGTVHSEEYFKQQILDIDTYNAYCEQHPEFANGLTKMSSEFIKEEYRKRYLQNGGQS